MDHHIFTGLFSPVKIYAPLAQLVEQLTLNQWVLGSSPQRRTTKQYLTILLFIFVCWDSNCVRPLAGRIPLVNLVDTPLTKGNYPKGAPKRWWKMIRFPSSFLSIAKAMVYHHAVACISSPKSYIISRRLYYFRNDDMPLFEWMICNFLRN